MTNPALDDFEEIARLATDYADMTGTPDQEADVSAKISVVRTALSNAPQVVTVSADDFDRLWQDAYNKSRGSSVFNKTPSFKKCLMDNLDGIGLKITAAPNGGA